MAGWYSISDINKPANMIIERGCRKCDRYLDDIVVPLNFLVYETKIHFHVMILDVGSFQFCDLS